MKNSINDILFSFSIFPRKQAFTFHADCLLRRQYAWKCLILFSRKTNKSTINLSSVELAQRAMKVKNHLENSLSWNTSVRKQTVLYTWIDSLSKLCRPRSDAGYSGVWSRSTLFAFTLHHEFISMLFWPPLSPLLFSKTRVYRGIHYFSYFCSNCERGGSNEYPQSMFWAEILKISEFFIWFCVCVCLEVKFSIYLNRRVSVMRVSSKVSEYSG